jgi:hypothetical protein|tara:strand:- start:106 stop:708 length:603 start_codon:yes stop_codon:yes gene_type:complete
MARRSRRVPTTPFGEAYSEDELRFNPYEEKRRDNREQDARQFQQMEAARSRDRQKVEDVLRDNDVEVDDLVSLAVEIMVDQFADGTPIGEKTLQKVFGKKVGAALTTQLNPVGRLAAESGRLSRRGYGSGRFQGQFGTNMGFQLPKPKRKRSTKEKAGDKKLSAAFKKANSSCRKKNGQFKKGKCQADIARLAHRLVKKM